VVGDGWVISSSSSSDSLIDHSVVVVVDLICLSGVRYDMMGVLLCVCEVVGEEGEEGKRGEGFYVFL